ncbi:MAG: phosphogluconate dehydrogenase C-terminal domain-containing protein [Propioniciclava sp.]
MTTIAVIGAGGKMGMRVSDNLAETDHDVRYVESSPAGAARIRDAGRDVTELEAAVSGAAVVVLAVPDIVLGTLTSTLVPQLDAGTIVLTLDPAAAYAGLLFPRKDIHYAVAHPCHPSVFYPRSTPEEWSDTFGGIACPMEVVAAYEDADPASRDQLEQVIQDMYRPVITVHWVTVKQLAQLEPTLVETIACMVGDLMKEALDETTTTLGVPAPAAQAMLYGHIQVALANAFNSDNPFSDACLIAMDYGRNAIIKEDWKRIFDDAQLDQNLQRMLHLDTPIQR